MRTRLSEVPRRRKGPTAPWQPDGKKGIPPEGTIRATYNFPKSIHKALKARSVEEDKTMLKMVLDAIEQAYGIKSKGE